MHGRRIEEDGRGGDQHLAGDIVEQRRLEGRLEGFVRSAAIGHAACQQREEDLRDDRHAEGAAHLLDRLQRARARTGIARRHAGQRRLEERRDGDAGTEPSFGSTCIDRVC